MNKFKVLQFLIIFCSFFLVPLPIKAALDLGMNYTPSSYCELKAQIISMDKQPNATTTAVKILEVIGLSEQFYSKFPREKDNITDEDCQKYYTEYIKEEYPDSIIRANFTGNTTALTDIKIGDTVKIYMHAAGDEWGTGYFIDNITKDNAVAINFNNLKEGAVYLAVIVALLLIIGYFILRKSKKLF